MGKIVVFKNIWFFKVGKIVVFSFFKNFKYSPEIKLGVGGNLGKKIFVVYLLVKKVPLFYLESNCRKTFSFPPFLPTLFLEKRLGKKVFKVLTQVRLWGFFFF